jgi:S1-C subfamily serine protease
MLTNQLRGLAPLRSRLAITAILVGALSVASAHAATPPASVAQGVVDITSQLPALGETAAGTGMLLGSSGEVLTNNHVIRGGTNIHITVPGGQRYPARVLGTDARKDVALLQIVGTPPAVAPVNLGDSSTAAVGEAVTAVGNAGGRGGAPSVATGSVTALGRSITASDDNGANPERLNGMIQVNAKIRPGDSGGPLLDPAGQVIGMDTAAASSKSPKGFAIPINRARAIVSQIEAGNESGGVHIGPAAFLGVEVLPAPISGAPVAGVFRGSPAAKTGLSAGDVITRLGGHTIRSAAGLSKALAPHHPGDAVRVRWRTPLGTSRTVTVRLGSGPPV